MKPLITPTINMNGNTADDLIEKLKLVLHNINHLEVSMRHACDIVHGRNFQTVDNTGETQRKAQDAWYERAIFLAKLHQEVEALAVAIMNQKAGRAIPMKDQGYVH